MSEEAGALVDEVGVDPATARVYAEGWQSWSPATWHAVTATGRVPAEDWEHLMRFRPGTPVTTQGIQGEGLVVVANRAGLGHFAAGQCDDRQRRGACGPVSVGTVARAAPAEKR